MTNSIKAEDVIKKLNLKPHPEGGYYRETFRDLEQKYNDFSHPIAANNKGDSLERGHSTAIYYLLDKGQNSHWHRVDAAEIWHYYAGAPLTLKLWDKQQRVQTLTLGADIFSGQQPQIIVPAKVWQAAESRSDWTLVGCTVAPGFSFSEFEMAAEDWQPNLS